MTQVPDHILQRLRTGTNFSTLPPVAIQVLQLAQDPEVEFARVADVVSADPAIAAKVMGIANSAIYARRRHSSNLRQALITLGLNASVTLALSFALASALNKPCASFSFQAYWRRTLLSAAWGKLLATELGRRDAEEVFLASLLQDLGMLVIDKLWPEVYDGISPFKIEHARICQHEQNCIGSDHRSIGAALLNFWNMPASLVQGVQHSHDPSAAGVEGEDKPFIRAVALSGILSDVWLGTRNDPAMRWVGQQAHKFLGIQPTRLGELFEQVRKQLPVAEELFQMDLYDQGQLQDITDAAREILMVHNLRQIGRQEDLDQGTKLLEEVNIDLRVANVRDPLTNAHNRRYFEQSLDREFDTATKHAWPLSVVFVDLDKFKQINDGYGYQTGDAILQAVAQLLRENLRDSDIVARFGGDEFVMLLPGTDAELADEVGTRLCEGIRARSIQTPDGQRVGVTLSLGVATCDSRTRFETAKELLAAADSALYHSKREGRNRHTCYDTIRAA
jgi:diguanylate cyclase (GGDEF)-like protein